MARRELHACGGWLIATGLGGLVIARGVELAGMREAIVPVLIDGGALLASLALVGGILLWLRTPSATREVPSAAVATVPSSTATSPPDHMEVARALLCGFLAWLHERDPNGNTWASFDAFVREVLAEHCGAQRIRCFRLVPGETKVVGLGRLPSSPDALPGSDLLRHVIETGREFVAPPGPQGFPGADAWSWVWPIREVTETVGIVAVGRASGPISEDCGLRHILSQSIVLFWNHVATLERLRISECTDKASGVLTRPDFFESAVRALRDAYAEREPVVCMVLSLEGLRHLDDSARWQERDQLVESVGRLIARRVRAEDLVGRFSDDRFVILLRRVDGALGRLIAEKLLNAAAQRAGEVRSVADAVKVRAGVAGGGAERPSLDALLVRAMGALERARGQQLAVLVDSEVPSAEATT